MTPKQKLKWEKIKAKGKARFVLESALAYGLGVALSAVVFETYRKSNTNNDFWNIFTLITFSFLIPASCAALGALWYWERSEKKEN